MSRIINEHDMTKKMMDIMRGGYKSLLKEDEAQAAPAPSAAPDTQPPMQAGDDLPEPANAPEEDKDTLTPKAGDAVYNEELKKLQEIVHPSAEIDNFKIYPNDKNVIIEGSFLQKEEEGTGIQFRMSLKAGEIETSMNNVDLNDEVNELLQHLKGHYKNWCNEWSLKMSNEYKPNHD